MQLMNFNIEKIRSLMTRIDESYNGYEEDSELSGATDNSISVDGDDSGYEEPEVSQEDVPQAKRQRTKKEGIVGDDKLFATWDFLKEEYDDSKFDKFFQLTKQEGDFKKLANNVHKAIVRDGGEYTVDLGYGNRVTGISKFLLPKNLASMSVTFFDAVYVFSFLERNSTNAANKIDKTTGKGYSEDKPWSNLTNMGYGQVNESVNLAYGNMMSLISEFNGCPIIQGYMKEAYHNTSNTNTLRIRLKKLITTYCQLETISPCSKATYDNNRFVYIPYLDMVQEDSNEAEKKAIEIISRLRAAISEQMGMENAQEISDYDFWKQYGLEFWNKRDKSGNIFIDIDSDVSTASGCDSILDEIINRFRVLLNKDAIVNKVKSDNDATNANPIARERRASVIRPDYDVAEELGRTLGYVSQEDVAIMKEHTLGEWLNMQEEDAERVDMPSESLRAHGPFKLDSIRKLHERLEEAGFEVNDERKEGNAYDFFIEYVGISKDKKAQSKVFDSCRDSIPESVWVSEFGNREALMRTRTDLRPYINKLRGTDPSLRKISLDMVGYRDVDDETRNFVAIEFQGDHHYRPTQTEGISTEDLYKFQPSTAAGLVNTWPQYWAIIDGILSMAFRRKATLNENGEREINTDRKGFLSSCVTVLKDAIDGKDGGMLQAHIKETCGYLINPEEYTDDFDAWSSGNRPKYKKKPIKSSIGSFADSYYRWFCELDTFMQSANDLAKFSKTNANLFTVDGEKRVGACGLFYVCPNNERVLPIEIIGNAITNPYRAAFYSETLSKIGLDEDTIRAVYTHTFRSNGDKNFDTKKCISIADGKTTLYQAINGILG